MIKCWEHEQTALLCLCMVKNRELCCQCKLLKVGEVIVKKRNTTGAAVEGMN